LRRPHPGLRPPFHRIFFCSFCRPFERRLCAPGIGGFENLFSQLVGIDAGDAGDDDLGDFSDT